MIATPPRATYRRTIPVVRRTVTLDPDTRVLVERAMREGGLTFDEAINHAIRAGLGVRAKPLPSYTTARALGPARANLAKALVIAAELDDEATVRRHAEGR